MFVAGCQQRNHVIPALNQQPVQGERGIFSAAPAKDDFFLHVLNPFPANKTSQT
jgi:hypothetical protein